MAPNAIARIKNWHVPVYAVLAALLSVGTLVVTGVIPMPPGTESVMPYVVLLVSFLGFFLPRIQTQTGPGAPDIISPDVAVPNVPHG